MTTATMHRLRLKEGQIVRSDRARPLLDDNGQPVPGRYERTVINRGQEFDSPKDLAALEPKRYERVGGAEMAATAAMAEAAALRQQVEELTARLAAMEGSKAEATAVAAPADNLDTLNIKQLRDLAEEREISLPAGYVPKADLIALIQGR